MPGRIFISYRREDEQGFALRLFERLAKAFGAANVFFDKSSIPPGFDFVDYIEKQIAQSDIVLVVLGRNWLSSTDTEGRRRLDNPDDFVAVEVGAALAQQKHVVPLVVHGASMPIAPELPDRLKSLARRNAYFAPNGGTEVEFSTLIDALAATLKELVSRKAPPEPTPREPPAAKPEPLRVHVPAFDELPIETKPPNAMDRRPAAAAMGLLVFVAASFVQMVLGAAALAPTAAISLLIGGIAGGVYLLGPGVPTARRTPAGPGLASPVARWVAAAVAYVAAASLGLVSADVLGLGGASAGLLTVATGLVVAWLVFRWMAGRAAGA